MTAPTPEDFERHLHEGPTLVEFILARVAEDELLADVVPVVRFSDVPRIESHSPSRVRAQCAAYRRIVGIYSEITLSHFAGEWIAGGGNGPEVYWDAIRELGSIWSDHPDYRQEWKP